MGNYKEIDGDLIKSFKNGEYDVMAHGCNCYATMGAGIALTIGKEFPDALMADNFLDIPNGMKRLGKLSYCALELDKNKKSEYSFIFNLYSQFRPGADFRIKAFQSSLKAMKRELKNHFTYYDSELKKNVFKPENIRVGLPIIGCGIGGGDWEEVSELIKTELSDYDVTIVHFKQKVVGVNYWPSPKPKNNSVTSGTYQRPKIDWGKMTDEEFENYLKQN